jgi:hypothetical protein
MIFMGSTNRTSSDTNTDEMKHRQPRETRDEDLPSFDSNDDYAENVQRIIEVVDVDGMTDESDLLLDVEVTEPAVTDDHPGRIHISVTNTGANPQVISEGLLSTPIASIEREPGLLLFPSKDDRKRKLNCWQPTEIPEDRGATGRVRLIPGGEEQVEYEVWSHYANESCMPAGEYRFKEYYRVSNGDEQEFEGGFTLRVREP